MHPQEIAAEVRRRYDAFAQEYRALDASPTDQEMRAHYGRTLQALCRSFGRPITVLDLGCGTGRYFHWLEQVQRLTGIDVSAKMLAEARQPLHRDRIAIPRIDLIRGDFHEQSFPPGAFDLIYAIGVLGEYAPFDAAVCQRIWGWLKPGGKCFFTVVDAGSKPDVRSLKRRLAEPFYPVLPKAWKAKIRQKRLWRSLYLTREALTSVVRESSFRDYTITHYASTDPHGWQGAHFDCLAVKSVAPEQHSDGSNQPAHRSLIPPHPPLL